MSVTPSPYLARKSLLNPGSFNSLVYPAKDPPLRYQPIARERRNTTRKNKLQDTKALFSFPKYSRLLDTTLPSFSTPIMLYMKE